MTYWTHLWKVWSYSYSILFQEYKACIPQVWFVRRAGVHRSLLHCGAWQGALDIQTRGNSPSFSVCAFLSLYLPILFFLLSLFLSTSLSLCTADYRTKVSSTFPGAGTLGNSYTLSIFFPSLSLSAFGFLSLFFFSLSVDLYDSLCRCLSLSLSIVVSDCLSLYISVSLSFAVSVSLSLSLSVPFSVSPSLSRCLSLSIPLSLCLTHSLLSDFLSVWLYLCLTLSLSDSLSLSISLRFAPIYRLCLFREQTTIHWSRQLRVKKSSTPNLTVNSHSTCSPR